MFEPNDHSKWQVHWNNVSPMCFTEICTLLRKYYGYQGVSSVAIVDVWQQASHNYKVTGQMDNNSYCILVRKNILSSATILLRIESLVSYLRGHSLSIPQIIPTTLGALLVQYNGNYWQVFTFMEGDHFRGEQDELIQAGTIIGKMHNAFHQFSSQDRIPVLNDVLAPLRNNCLDEVAHMRDENELIIFLREAKDFIEEKIRQALNQLETTHEQEGIIHCDLHPHNFLFSHKQLTAIIDFGQIALADQNYDVAMACHRLVRQYVIYQEKPWQETLAKGIHTFLDAYTGIVPMADQRIRLLPTFIASLLLRKIIYNFSLYKTGKRNWDIALAQVKKFLSFFEEINAIKAILT